jgi:hypothetical protein
VADANTISRIGGILKNTFAPAIEEQQQLVPDVRKLFGTPKADAWKAPGSFYVIPARVNGNVAGIAPSASDDPLPTAGRQNEKQWNIYDRGYLGKIQMYEADMLNTDKAAFQAFISHQTDEVKGITRDYMKQINIDLSAGDGSGVRGLIQTGATSATQTLALGTGSFQYGSMYLQPTQVIDIYDSTLTTSRTAGAGVTINSITRSSGGSNPTVVLSASVATTTGDVVVWGAGRVNKSYVGLLGMLRNQNVTFQALSTTTYPILQATRMQMAGQPLTESVFQQLEDAVMRASGEDNDMFGVGLAQWAAYTVSAYSQKRFMDMTVDKGFTKAKYDGKDVVKLIDVPSAVAMALTKDTIKFGAVAPWGPSEMDDSFLKPVQGFAAYYAWFRERGNMVFTRPNANAIADQLAYNTSASAYAQ